MSLHFAIARRIVIGTIVLACLCCLMTNAAHASCGDWLANHSELAKFIE